ncbi:hypothetical protein Vafri_20904 [Volvox africanus]|uniref:Uncharacterized protein n=1 Tax=Volvox africanus TaxID=51714 RepID=A0A8J4FDK6_9CHLO|nr:hypothetical protein Vafri_20904 [Volvox africanus]
MAAGASSTARSWWWCRSGGNNATIGSAAGGGGSDKVATATGYAMRGLRRSHGTEFGVGAARPDAAARITCCLLQPLPPEHFPLLFCPHIVPCLLHLTFCGLTLLVLRLHIVHNGHMAGHLLRVVLEVTAAEKEVSYTR